jgi:hypothetical protein
MIRIFLFASSLLLFNPAPVRDDWIERRNRDGIIIHTLEKEGNPLKEYRVSATINFPLQEVYLFSTDLEYRPAWVVRCVGLEILDTLHGSHILYHTAYDIPWPLSDRDLLVECSFSLDTLSGKAHLLTITSDADYPPEEGFIRMAQYREEVFLEEIGPGRTLFRAEGFADPGGSLPAWVVNMFLVDGIYDSVIRTWEEMNKRYKQVPGEN